MKFSDNIGLINIISIVYNFESDFAKMPFEKWNFQFLRQPVINIMV